MKKYKPKRRQFFFGGNTRLGTEVERIPKKISTPVENTTNAKTNTEDLNGDGKVNSADALIVLKQDNPNYTPTVEPKTNTTMPDANPRLREGTEGRGPLGGRTDTENTTEKEREEHDIKEDELQREIQKDEKYLYRVGKEDGVFKTMCISLNNFEVIRKKYFLFED